jgi:NDP-sugar pyrophosphorylase family protein
MQEALQALRERMATFAKPEPMAEDEWQTFAENCVVALPAGGAGLRMQAASYASPEQKSALALPGGDTMLGRTIRMYQEAGLREFVALVYYQAQAIEALLGDGSTLGVTLRYSHDPGRAVGRGGAIRNALEQGLIPRTKSLIVHNPDDQIVNYPGSFPRDIVRAHLTGCRRRHIATAVVAEGTPYPYSGMRVQAGAVEEVEMYPLVPIPTHTGVTVFSPEAYPLFLRLFDLERKTDFEAVLFPALAKERRLYATAIPTECWIPVNDAKALQRLVEALQAH